MHNNINEIPSTTAEEVRLISVIMADDPRKLRALGLNTVYKHPRTTVLSICEIVNANPVNQSASATFFSNVASAISTGYLIQLSIPEDCYNEVFRSLENEPLITKINNNKTISGQAVENKISDIMTDTASSQNYCCIM